jgi:hypothetical protein
MRFRWHSCRTECGESSEYRARGFTNSAAGRSRQTSSKATRDAGIVGPNHEPAVPFPLSLSMRMSRHQTLRTAQGERRINS